MQVTRNVFTIADLVKWLDEKSLIINRDYQRGSGLWPINARSYFIDTILNGYPFPKVTSKLGGKSTSPRNGTGYHPTFVEYRGT
jgi:hypothetical protein